MSSASPLSRVNWTCPGCGKAYSVPSTVGLTVCPKCAAPAVKPSVSDRTRIVVACAVSLLIAAMLWSLFTGATSDRAAAIGEHRVGREAMLDADKQAVGQWLRENLPDGKWEEIQWWPPVDLQATYDRKVSKLQEAIAENQKKGLDVAGYKGQLAELRQRGVRRICGIKYRAKSAYGSLEVDQQLFDVGHGTLRRVVFDPRLQTVESFDHDGLQVLGWKYLTIQDYDPENDPENPFRNPLRDAEKILMEQRKDRVLPPIRQFK